MIGRVREQPPSAGNLAQLDAAVFFLKLGAQIHQRLFHAGRLRFQHVGKRYGSHRLVGHEEHRFERTFQLAFLQT